MACCERLWPIIVGDDEITAEPDTAVYVPLKKYQYGEEVFKVLWVFSPPGLECTFIEKMGGSLNILFF